MVVCCGVFSFVFFFASLTFVFSSVFGCWMNVFFKKADVVVTKSELLPEVAMTFYPAPFHDGYLSI